MLKDMKYMVGNPANIPTAWQIIKPCRSAAFPVQGKTPVSLIHFDHDASNRSLYFSWP
jgi:hypothetical protein